uniref:Uncharacterized protein n=1 Tax=Cannabis sativa TaxID=3483 RepID=A0A803PIP5_CANSA
MVVARRTLATTSASLGLPQDPMTTNFNVRVPATTETSTNPTDLANPTNLAGPTNSTNTTRPVNPANPTDPTPASQGISNIGTSKEGFVNVEQPPLTTTDFVPWYYLGEIGSGIDEPAIGEPHVGLEEDFELARLREVVCQVGQTKEPRVVGCDVFANRDKRQWVRKQLEKIKFWEEPKLEPKLEV